MMSDTVHPVYTFELVGSYIARHLESGIEVNAASKRRTVKSPIPILCRQLIATGFDPQARVHVIRKALCGDRFIPIFKRDRTLAAWAELDCIDSDETGLRFVKFRPFPVSLKAAESGGVPEVAPGSSRTENAPKALHRTAAIAA